VNYEDYLQALGCEEILPKPIIVAMSSMQKLSINEDFASHRVALGSISVDNLILHVFARYRWLLWCEHASEVSRALTEQGIESLPEGIMDECTSPDELRMLSRSLQEGMVDENQTALVIWRKCIELAQQKTRLEVEFAQANHSRNSAYESLLGAPKDISEFEDMDWIRIQAGMKESVLNPVWHHDTDAMDAAISSDLKTLQDVSGSKNAKSFIEKQITGHLGAALVERASLHAEENLAHAAGTAFSGYLRQAPVVANPLGAAFVGSERQRVGLAIIDRKGNLVAKAPIRPCGDWTERVIRWFAENRVQAVVLPTTAGASHWLEPLTQSLQDAELDLVSVPPAGMVTARAADDPILRRASSEVASAIVLARRAMRPLEEWGRMDPLRLGLVPNLRDQNGQRFSELLALLREQSLGTGEPVMAVPLGTDLRARVGSILNPAVTCIEDLKPGMTLAGAISNVTKFGAFVNIGIKNEGLVHISELSDEFVGEPSEVVKSGQQVTVRVLSVDLERNRIALTMRSEGRMGKKPLPRSRTVENSYSTSAPTPSPSRPAGDASSEGDPGSRSKALEDLERLFQK